MCGNLWIAPTIGEEGSNGEEYAGQRGREEGKGKDRCVREEKEQIVKGEGRAEERGREKEGKKGG